MKRSCLLAMLLAIWFSASSQSAWDIGYICIDSISSKDIGRLAKIDFKWRTDPSNNTVIRDNRNPRYFITPIDTGQIVFAGDTIELIERRKIYADWGLYREQYLECPNYKQQSILKVYETEIIDVKEDSILFRVFFEIYARGKRNKAQITTRDTALCWIKKNQLNGVIIKE